MQTREQFLRSRRKLVCERVPKDLSASHILPERFSKLAATCGSFAGITEWMNRKAGLTVISGQVGRSVRNTKGRKTYFIEGKPLEVPRHLKRRSVEEHLQTSKDTLHPHIINANFHGSTILSIPIRKKSSDFQSRKKSVVLENSKLNFASPDITPSSDAYSHSYEDITNKNKYRSCHESIIYVQDETLRNTETIDLCQEYDDFNSKNGNPFSMRACQRNSNFQQTTGVNMNPLVEHIGELSISVVQPTQHHSTPMEIAQALASEEDEEEEDDGEPDLDEFPEDAIALIEEFFGLNQ